MSPASTMEASSSSSYLFHDSDLAFNETSTFLTDHWYFMNATLLEKWQQYVSNRAVDDEAFTALILTYSVLILTGATGNGLVCLVVARKPQMRTARNIFIINLAISDLLLCVFTMPFTLTEILLKVWPLGEFMCKMVSALQATSIYVSTMSITAIALDRYNVIVYPTREWTKRLGAVVILSSIWLIAFLLALPLFVFRTQDRHYVGLPQLEYVVFCYEEWPVEHGRAFYSIASMLFQYVLPIVIVSVVYARICKKLQHRMSNKIRLNSAAQPKETDHRRIKKTNLLLISIALIFGISWLPLNIFNVVTDWHYSFASDRTFRVVFASCHVIGMSSACSNPLLYGWLNDNFRKEFREVFTQCYGCLARLLAPILRDHDSSPVPLVVYTKQSLVNADGRGHLQPRMDCVAFNDETTVVTQLTITTGN